VYLPVTRPVTLFLFINQRVATVLPSAEGVTTYHMHIIMITHTLPPLPVKRPTTHFFHDLIKYGYNGYKISLYI
jgi:hypothetical protein